jgi:hypothetical protein
MYFIITIDTEEDNWARYSRDCNPVNNINRIVNLQGVFDKHSITPTYLITYPVATNEESVKILKGILNKNKCEIGAHCHPWNTPPFTEPINESHTMLCNLDPDLIYEKLKHLHEKIVENFDITPVSFRAGRWGFNEAVAHALYKLGYRVDTSVSPFVDWRKYSGPDYRSFPCKPYEFNVGNVTKPVDSGDMLEVPASVGYQQPNFGFASKLERMLETEFCSFFHLKGICSRLNMLNKVWLSPEQSSYRQMKKLSDNLARDGVNVLNFTFHSTSLMHGLGPFVTSEDDENAFLEEIDNFLSYASSCGWKSICLSDYLDIYNS